MSASRLIATMTIGLSLPILAEEATCPGKGCPCVAANQNPQQAMWFTAGLKNSNFYYDPNTTEGHYFNPKAFLSFTYRSGTLPSPHWKFYYGTGFCLEANKKHQIGQGKLGDVSTMQTFVEQSDYMKAFLLLGYWMPNPIGGAQGLHWGFRVTATSSNTRERRIVQGTGEFVGGTTQSLLTQTRYALVFADRLQTTLTGAYSELEIGLAHDPFFGPSYESHRLFIKGDLHVPIADSKTSAAYFSATVNKSRKAQSADEVLVELGYLLRLK